MDGLLTAIKSVQRDAGPSLVAVGTNNARKDEPIKPAADLSQDIPPEQVIQILKSQPNSEELIVILAALDPYDKSRKVSQIDVRIPGPTTAQILQILVSTTVPDHWQLLNAKGSKSSHGKGRAALLRCFNSIAGVGSLLAELRALLSGSSVQSQNDKNAKTSPRTLDILSVLSALLEPHEFIQRIFIDISSIYGARTRQQAAWREFVSLIAAGKILSTVAEALSIVNLPESMSSCSWVGEGPRYASWLGSNIAILASGLSIDDADSWTSLALLTSRSLSLGYSGEDGLFQFRSCLRKLILI